VRRLALYIDLSYLRKPLQKIFQDLAAKPPFLKQGGEL